MGYFPFFVELEGKEGLIVGGGRIAAHKIEKIKPFGSKADRSRTVSGRRYQDGSDTLIARSVLFGCGCGWQVFCDRGDG